MYVAPGIIPDTGVAFAAQHANSLVASPTTHANAPSFAASLIVTRDQHEEDLAKLGLDLSKCVDLSEEQAEML